MSRAPRPFRPITTGPFGIVAGSFVREAANRDYQIGFHCHTVPQNSCPTLRQSGAARTYTYRANKVVRILAQEGNINPSHPHLSQTWLRNHVVSYTGKKKTFKSMKNKSNENVHYILSATKFR